MRRMSKIGSLLVITIGLAIASCGGCDNSTAGSSGNGSGTNGTNNGTATGTNNGTTPFTTNSNGQVLCKSGNPCACSDGIDNDGDGLVDLQDPECTGPYDDDEATFATGIPGDNKDDCQDCFFDGNSGSGDDGCQYATQCLFGMDPGGQSACHNCSVASQCKDFCKPRTPNGCDCFGCCEVYLPDGSMQTVVLGGDCSIDDLSNCQTGCTLDTQCQNPCGRCELCLGKTEADLPADCAASVPDAGTSGSDAGTPIGHTCDNGEQVCNVTDDCATGFYCQLGCCLPVIQ